MSRRTDHILYRWTTWCVAELGEILKGEVNIWQLLRYILSVLSGPLKGVGVMYGIKWVVYRRLNTE